MPAYHEEVFAYDTDISHIHLVFQMDCVLDHLLFAYCIISTDLVERTSGYLRVVARQFIKEFAGRRTLLEVERHAAPASERHTLIGALGPRPYSERD